jgi:hypothetical protein
VAEVSEEKGRRKNWPTPTGLTRAAPRSARSRATLWIIAALAVAAVVAAVLFLVS